MDIKLERLAAHLASPPLPAACLVASPEPLLVLEAGDAIRAAARAQGITEREIHEAEGKQREPDWSALEASFRAPSLFSSRRMLELRLPTGRPGVEGSRVICAFCDDPHADVLLLVTCGDWSAKHVGKWSQAIARVGIVVAPAKIKPHELVGWIEKRLRAKGVQANRDAVQRLADRVDGNLLAADQEIEKLALLSDGAVLDGDHMDALVADAARFDVFRLVDAAMNGEAAQVSRMLAGLRAEGEVVPALLGMVVKELQRAAAIARVQARGGNVTAEFRAQQVWDSRQAAYLRALSRHPAAQWERFVARLASVDQAAKGRAAGDPWILLERLLLAVADKNVRVALAS